MFITTALAMATIFVAAPAFAQSDEILTPETPAAQDGVAPEGAPVVAPEAVTAAGSFLTEQTADQHLASDWIGKSVYNSADENLGDIADLLIGENGSVEGVVLGVGGFLGIGEKSVGVPFDALHTTADENGTATIHLDATGELLEAAPDFQALADIEAERLLRRRFSSSRLISNRYLVTTP